MDGLYLVASEPPVKMQPAEKGTWLIWKLWVKSKNEKVKILDNVSSALAVVRSCLKYSKYFLWSCQNGHSSFFSNNK
jgi:hypothetical protein